MSIDYAVPFVPNAEDDLHCYPASLLMMLTYFRPETSLDLEVTNKISGMVGERAAWPIAGPLWFARNGFEVNVMFDFDYPKLAEMGVSYIASRYGDEVAEWQEENTDLPTSELITEFLSEVKFEQRVPALDEIKKALNDGALLTATVNVNELSGEDGYVGHSVVIKGMTDTEFILHNPGLPAIENQTVKFDAFANAWSWPTEDARYLMSIKPTTKTP